MNTLKFSTGNAKLDSRLIFNLPAGYSCPHAGVCKTLADRNTGTIMDLPQDNGVEWQEYRCFAAMAETRPTVRDARWHNWDLIRNVMYQCDGAEDQTKAIYELIEQSIGFAQPVRQHHKLLRIHESGDFWTQVYFNAWLEVARNNQHIKFYGYTKSLGMWYQMHDNIPSNMYLTASAGGTLDNLIIKYPEIFKRIAYVVYTEKEAQDLGLEIDHDDSHCFGDKPFALLVHGIQRAGSLAQQSLTQRKKLGTFTGYNKTKQIRH